MRYHVRLSADLGAPSSSPEAAWEVEVSALPGQAWEVRVNGRPVAVDVASMERQSNVRVDGRVVDLTVHGKLPALGIVANGQRLRARVDSERSMGAASGDRSHGGRAVAGASAVRSPMPGRVVKVLVGRGDEVQPGQALVVFEAMKMENEVRASTAGTVAEVHVAAGTAVESSAVLVTLA
jgi:biotin carboxyl carrier protein